MRKRIFLIIILIINLLVITSNADEIDYEENDEIWEQTQEIDTKKEELPKINSRAVVVFDRESKTVIYEKNMNSKRAQASTTKIMTAIVALEKGNLNETIEICKKAANTGGSRLGIKTGDRISLKDLLYGLLLRSGNDAAVQIAIHIGGNIEGFAKMMNEKAKELGLENTNFVTPHGLDNSNHYTTAYELAVLTDYAMKNNLFSKIVGTKQTTIYINSNPVTINNTNELLGNLDGVNGVKTGFTSQAGRCLVTSVNRNNLQIITVVLGADTKKDRTKDSINLIEYTYKNYEQINIKQKVIEEFETWKKDNLSKIKIIKGKTKDLQLGLKYNYDYELYPIKKTEAENVKIQIEYKDILEAPQEMGTQIGSAHIILENKEIMSIPIVIANKQEKKNIKDYFIELITAYVQDIFKVSLI